MIPSDALRALADALGYTDPLDPYDATKLIAHAKDVTHNRSAAWKHFEGEVRRRCRVTGRLKAARQERDALRMQVAALGGWPTAWEAIEVWRVGQKLEWEHVFCGGRWTTRFRDCAVSTSLGHVGGSFAYGEGQTPGEAMATYIPQITRRLLCHCPGFARDQARWIEVPAFSGIPPHE